MKLMIWIGITLGGLIGGWLGTMLDHGNGLGAWTILLSTVGGIVGIWAGYKIGQNLE